MNYCNPQGFRNVISELAEGDKNILFTWFDGGKDVNDVFKKGARTFARLMLPHAKKHLKDLSDKVSLDIGYGSGAQVVAAAGVFEKAYGLDVHNQHPTFAEEMQNQGAEDFALLGGDGHTIPMDNDTVDFVHSWTTFLHLNGIENVQSYLEEIKRVLKPQGIAIIYFTRLIRSKSQQSEAEYHADIALENDEKLGYRYGGDLTKVRAIAMIVSMWKMTELAEAAGLDVVDKTFSYEGKGKSKRIFGQHGIVLKNPDEPEEEEEGTPPEQSTQSTGDSDGEQEASQTPPPTQKKTKKKMTSRRKTSSKKSDK